MQVVGKLAKYNLIASSHVYLLLDKPKKGLATVSCKDGIVYLALVSNKLLPSDPKTMKAREEELVSKATLVLKVNLFPPKEPEGTSSQSLLYTPPRFIPLTYDEVVSAWDEEGRRAMKAFDTDSIESYVMLLFNWLVQVVYNSKANLKYLVLGVDLDNRRVRIPIEISLSTLLEIFQGTVTFMDEFYGIPDYLFQQWKSLGSSGFSTFAGCSIAHAVEELTGVPTNAVDVVLHAIKDIFVSLGINAARCGATNIEYYIEPLGKFKLSVNPKSIENTFQLNFEANPQISVEISSMLGLVDPKNYSSSD